MESSTTEAPELSRNSQFSNYVISEEDQRKIIDKIAERRKLYTQNNEYLTDKIQAQCFNEALKTEAPMSSCFNSDELKKQVDKITKSTLTRLDKDLDRMLENELNNGYALNFTSKEPRANTESAPERQFKHQQFDQQPPRRIGIKQHRFAKH